MIYLRCRKKAIDGITVNDRDFLKTIESFVLTLDSDRNGDFFRIAILILAAGFVAGPSVERLVELTNYPLLFAKQVCDNMRAAGLWTDKRIVAEWMNEDGTWNHWGLFFHVAVAQGKLTARLDGERVFYQKGALL